MSSGNGKWRKVRQTEQTEQKGTSGRNVCGVGLVQAGKAMGCSSNSSSTGEHTSVILVFKCHLHW